MVSCSSRVVPVLQYADARAAMSFLCRTFGFTTGAVMDDGAGGVLHAELWVGRSGNSGGSVIMLRSASGVARPTAEQPQDAVGMSAYVVVDDVEAHYARASAAEARVVAPPARQPFGGSGYACLDLEGVLWRFCDRDPFATASPSSSSSAARATDERLVSITRDEHGMLGLHLEYIADELPSIVEPVRHSGLRVGDVVLGVDGVELPLHTRLGEIMEPRAEHELRIRRAVSSPVASPPRMRNLQRRGSIY